MNKVGFATFLVTTALLTPAVPSAYAEVTGRINASYFKNTDDYSGYMWDFWTTDVRLKADKFHGDNKTIFFDGRMRGAGASDYNQGIAKTRIKDLNLEVKAAFANTDYTVGRHYVGYLPGARVDGVSFKHNLGENYAVGLYGGVQPDPYTENAGSDFTSFGLYGFRREKVYGATGGYVTSRYKGKEDSSFVYLQGDYALGDLSMNTSLRADHRVDIGGYEPVNFLAGCNYRFERVARLGVQFHQYRAVQLYESMDYNIYHEKQSAYRVSGLYNITKTTRIHARYDTRTRDSDKKKAELVMFGVRESNLFSVLYADLSYRKARYFTSRSDQVRLSLGAEVGEGVSCEINGTAMNNTHDDAPNKLQSTSYGLSVDYMRGKNFYASANYEVSADKYLDVESIYTAKVESAWKSSSLFVLLGYSF